MFVATFWSCLATGTQPVVAIHDSELTRALESTPATPPTPAGTGFQWWLTNWHYFFMVESLKEALTSDGTAFRTVSDADISAGELLDANGRPQFPILISLASEAVQDSEIAQLTNYVAAGGFLFVGSSAFTRNPDGSTRGNFAFSTQLGVKMITPGLQNWVNNSTFLKAQDQRIIAHIPNQLLTWQMPSAADEISWGTSPNHSLPASHLAWAVQPGDAMVLAQGDTTPLVCLKRYGQGYFIYHAGIQPLLGHGGYAPGMYAYLIFRKAIEWAFESGKLPIPKLSPWPYAYDSAFMVRHDFEDYQSQIASIEASAQFEYTNGAKGDYFFCTGTLRQEMGATYDTNAIIASLRRAVTNYGATIGPHNGGLKNANNTSLVVSNFDYWHWGPDEGLDVTANLPNGFANGADYARSSLVAAFFDMETWLSGLTNGLRSWVSPYFNGTREGTFRIEEQLGCRVNGEQKLGPFPSWVLSKSLQTAGKRYPFVSLPVSDWFVSDPTIAQAMESGHTTQSIQALVDFYYNLGALINLYSHSSSAGNGTAGPLVGQYIRYCLGKPRVWSANSSGIYQWWASRAAVQVTPGFTNVGAHCFTTFAISGAADPQTAVELLAPAPSFAGLEVFFNGLPASSTAWRTNGQEIKLLVGNTITNAEIRYFLLPAANNDAYTLVSNATFSVPTPAGVLSNDLTALGGALNAQLLTGPAHGLLTLNSDGSFSYTPSANYLGTDSFSYQATDALTNSTAATTTLTITTNHLPIAVDDSYFLGANATLQVGSPGVLINDMDPDGTTLTAGVVASPQHGSLTLASDGGFSYVPATGFVGVDSFIYTAQDGSANGKSANVTLTTFPAGYSFFDDFNRPANSANPLAPWQPQLGNWTVINGLLQGTSSLQSYGFAQFTNNSWTNYSVQARIQFPEGAYAGGLAGRLNPLTGARYAAWLYPEKISGPSNLLRLLKFQNWTNWSILQAAPLSAVGTNWHSLKLSFLANQIFLQFDGSQILTATDTSEPYLSGSVSVEMYRDWIPYTVSLAEMILSPPNNSPSLLSQTNHVIDVLTTLTVTNAGSDVDSPFSVLSYQLVGSPAGAGVGANGVISWTPSQAQGPSTNIFTTVVTDNGLPALSATNSFTVIVTGTYAGIDLTDPVQAAADPDGDGRSNLLEYALGTDPRNPADGKDGALFGTAQDGLGKHLILTFRRRKNVPGLQSIVEVSSDKQTWYSDSAHVQLIGITPLNDQFDWITMEDLSPLTSSAPRFIRLRAVMN